MSCACEHTIRRDGTSQLDRYLKALDPNYAPIDDRGIKELLVYAQRYAGQIRFYDLPGQSLPDGVPEAKVSWKTFFKRDVAVIAASIGVLDLEQIKKDYDETRTNLDAGPDAEILAALYKPIVGMAVRLENWLAQAIPSNPLYQDMHLAINSSLSIQLQKAMAIEAGFVIVDASTNLNVDYSEIKNQELWRLTTTPEPDLTVYEGDTDADKIRNSALYIDDVFLSFYGYLSGLVDRSTGYLQDALEQYPSHQPHMALFIAFLKLFALVQEQMNGITDRMLTFYYREVLQLQEKPAIPDKVHIVFELAKGVTDYRIVKDTELDAGKDDLQQDRVYLTDDQIVVNQAKVAELKTLYIEKGQRADGNSSIQGLYARPYANSQDGYGRPFETEYPKWDTFGRGRIQDKLAKNICDRIDHLKDAFLSRNEAAIGFAIASPQLVLQGGNRLIRYELSNLHQLLESSVSLKHALQIKLTTEKGWLTVDQAIAPGMASKLASALQSGKFLGPESQIATGYYISEDELSIYLPPGEVPIVGYDAEIHKSAFTTSFPVMQVLLGPQLFISEEKLKSFNPSSSSLEVVVGSMNTGAEAKVIHMDGLTQISLQNSTGVLDGDNEFDPFTAYPNQGKSLYIGSHEVFNKTLSALSVNVQLAQDISEPETPMLYSAMIANSDSVDFIDKVRGNVLKVNYRQKRQWRPLSDPEKGISFGGLTQNIAPANKERPLLKRSPLTYYEGYDRNVIKGFLEIQYNFPIRPDGKQTSFQMMQELAELLKVKAISISYKSKLDQLDHAIDQFYHVYPFGTFEVNDGAFHKGDRSIMADARRLTQITKLEPIKGSAPIYPGDHLLPQFTYTPPYSDLGATQASHSSHKQIREASFRRDPSLKEQLVYNTSGIGTILGSGTNQYSGQIQEEGLLYIGIEHLKPLQMLTLLFQFAEGSAQDEDNDPPEIHWSYLSNNEWKPLPDANIVSDGTYGFQTTGIVKIDVPADATNNNTIVTTGLHWFRTSVTENSHRIPKLVDVVTQAVLAKFDDRDNDPSHYACPLPAESIGKLVTGSAEVKAVKQPFASWNGKAKEVGKEFFVRVSERLRHKARAINSWDYEHLVLHRFPSIYKVKALTHTDSNCLCRENTLTAKASQTTITYTANGALDPSQKTKLKPLLNRDKDLTVEITAINTMGDVALVTALANRVKEMFIASGFAAGNISISIAPEGKPLSIEIQLLGDTRTETFCCGPQIAPGHVMVVPISNFKSRNAINPLQPKTSRRTLLEIEDYLKKRTSPFVRIHAKNPVYEQIMVFFRVRFHTGVDKGYHLKLLNDEIVKYLTPWAFDASAEVRFDQKIYASSIINFIEERNYVDFIKDFFMGVCKQQCCPEPLDVRPKPPVVEAEVVKEDSFENISTNDPNVTTIQGIIKDAVSDESIIGAQIFDPAASSGTVTDVNGEFSFDLQASELEINISMIGYASKTIKVAANTRWTIYLYPEQLDEIVVTSSRSRPENQRDDLEEMFSRFCGCEDVEKELSNSEFIGETVITPSTNRSLLVSVSKHIIIPCDETPVPDPCEERKRQLAEGHHGDSSKKLITTATKERAPQPVGKELKNAAAKGSSASESEVKAATDPTKAEKEKAAKNVVSNAIDSLQKKTVKELRTMAKAKKIPNYWTMRKKDLMAALHTKSQK